MPPSLSAPARRNVVIACVTGGAIAVHLGAAVFFASHDPYTSTIFPPCPILALTGYRCPGCGGTRAAYSLLHGDFASAIRMNPLVVVMYPVLLGLGASLLAGHEGRSRLGKALSLVALWLFVAGLAYSALVRNVFAL